MAKFFQLIHTSKKSRARVGKIHTPHGTIDTPGFVAVGTNGTLKALDNVQVSHSGLQLMFCNTYHFLVHGAEDMVGARGGLHEFIGRKGPIITDSGGFQVFSLAYGSVANELKSRGQKAHDGSVLKIDEEGVTFRSYRDGKKIVLTPESSVATQKLLGADIIIPLDELPPYHIGEKALQDSFLRTHRWEKRSLDRHLAERKNQSMYSVIHGGVREDLRKESARTLRKLPFDGHAIGGSLGKNKDEMVAILDWTVPELPQDLPNHLLGIGDLESIQLAVPRGVDTFDSSYPTRAARHGHLFTFSGTIKVEQRAYRDAFRPIEEDCPCHTCQNYDLAYVHHLFKAKEQTAQSLASIHNIAFMVRYMERLRQTILEDRI